MKKRRLSVRIDGIWYRVAHGKLHKITHEAPDHASRRSRVHAKSYNRDSSPDVSDQALVGDNMATLTMCSTHEQPARRTTPCFFRSQRRFQSRLALPGMTNEAPKWQMFSGSREDHPRKPEVSTGIDGLCSFVGGTPQEDPSFELDDPERVSDSDESCMSTATSAKKPLVIRIKMAKVTGM